MAARMLRKHISPQDLFELSQHRTHIVDTIKTARPTAGLPGLGSNFWTSSRFHMDDSAQRATLAEQYPRLAPMEGSIITAQDCNELLGQWVNEVTSKASELSATPSFSISEGSWTVGNLGGHTVVKLDLKYNGEENCWQNGKPCTEPLNSNIWWHATRSPLIPSILAHGLKATIVSHGYKGLWVNTHAASALSWTVNPFDLFPTVLFQLRIQKDILVHNSKVQAGNVHRSVACTPLGETLPNIIIQALYIRIPTVQHRNWQLGLRKALHCTITKITQYDRVDSTQVDELFEEIWHLTSWRTCYYDVPDSRTLKFGGPFQSTSILAANLSMTLAEIIAGLRAKSVNTKLRHFHNVPLEAVPKPVQDWLESNYPRINTLFSPVSPDAVQSGSIWQFHNKIAVSPWSVSDKSLNPAGWI